MNPFQKIPWVKVIKNKAIIIFKFHYNLSQINNIYNRIKQREFIRENKRK